MIARVLAATARETVVLLHSSASSSRQWNALAGVLSTRCDVRTVDFYGHGARAPWPEARPFTLADDATLVDPILRSAGAFTSSVIRTAARSR